ncbi:MAG: GNAT family N-acetyltransferase [Armatimonadota bacterium]|nr:GNAT family N-acetyltransferase [bacterium]MDW8320817.1 GNAT family N-acetyltransferase [Armatimonadota bacterium]
MSCSSVTIRAAQPEDAASLARLYVEAFGSKLQWAFGRFADTMPVVVQHLLMHDQMRLSESLVAEVDGQVVGMAVLRRDHTHRPAWLTVWRLVRPHVKGWRMLAAAFIMTAMCSNLCTPARSYVESLAVDARYRGRGIGTQLLERCIEESRRADKREISLHVVDTNPRAKQLYERMGFRTVRTERFGWVASRWMGFSAQHFMARPV